MNLEQKLVQELQKNEQVLQIVAVEDLEKEYQARKNKFKSGAAYVAPIKDAVAAGKIIKEFGIKATKVVIKQYAGKKYVIIKGYPGARNVLTGTRYLASNPKVVRMAIGPKGIVKSVKGGFAITVVLSVGIEVFDYLIRDTATLSHLLGTVTSDLIKIGISTIAGAVAGLAVGSAAIIGSIAAAPLIAAIAVGVMTGIVLDKIDSHFGATKALIQAYDNIGVRLREIKWEFNRNMRFLEENPQWIPCLFGPCRVRGY
ncbi:hypothetical protein [Aliikangiella maris]|uniref:Uncharacterized protein n=2 Tax=Aliikangiella maris TaxID=3162458 RepID=A0ABV2BSP5_9GAMM